MLTSFAQLLAVAAAVWGRDAVQLLRFLAELLGIAASSHAIQGTEMDTDCVLCRIYTRMFVNGAC